MASRFRAGKDGYRLGRECALDGCTEIVSDSSKTGYCKNHFRECKCPSCGQMYRTKRGLCRTCRDSV